MQERLVALLAGALALGGCSDHTGPGASDSPPPASANVSVQDNQFVATQVRILAGGTVTWTWRGSNPHNVTFTGGQASATQSDGTFQRNFASAGSFSYTCTIHGQSMSGTVTVVEPSQSDD